MTRARIAALVAVCVVALGAAAGFVLHSRAGQRDARAQSTPGSTRSLQSFDDAPRIVFRDTALGGGYGRLAVVALDDPGGARAVSGLNCDRVYASTGRVLCLASKPGLATTYTATVLTESLSRTQSLPLTGIPSRARLSADAKLAATTSFTAGDSYASTGFSTRTVVTRLGGGTASNLEDFTLRHDGRTVKPVDRNFWGVTFARDDNTFYATVAWSGKTWLVRGDLAARTVTTIHQDAECPSLSPDGTHIVFKQRGSLPPGQWRLVGYDVATGAVTPLAETHSVDDQVEWLDDDHVVYGLPRTGSQAAVDDVWSVPADGSGAPTLLIKQAWSPAVVR